MDPNSPPGVEYALPLQSAREQGRAPRSGGGSDAEPSSSSAAAPAFGSGITSTTASAAGEKPAGNSQARRPGSAANRPSAGAGDARAPALPRVAATDDVSGVPLLASLGGALGVLLLGALVALSLRRRRPPAV